MCADPSMGCPIVEVFVFHVHCRKSALNIYKSNSYISPPPFFSVCVGYCGDLSRHAKGGYSSTHSLSLGSPSSTEWFEDRSRFWSTPEG